MADRIVVTPRSAYGHPAVERIRAAGYEVDFPAPGAVPTPAQLHAALADSVGYLAGVEPVTEHTGWPTRSSSLSMSSLSASTRIDCPAR